MPYPQEIDGRIHILFCFQHQAFFYSGFAFWFFNHYKIGGSFPKKGSSLPNLSWTITRSLKSLMLLGIVLFLAVHGANKYVLVILSSSQLIISILGIAELFKYQIFGKVEGNKVYRFCQICWVCYVWLLFSKAQKTIVNEQSVACLGIQNYFKNLPSLTNSESHGNRSEFNYIINLFTMYVFTKFEVIWKCN